MNNIPFQTVDWSTVEKVETKGETGIAISQSLQFDGIQMRLVEYSPNYKADHWCPKGHIVHCLEGEFITALETGELVHIQQHMSFIVSDDLSSHQSITTTNAVKLLIIDGNFLKPKI